MSTRFKLYKQKGEVHMIYYHTSKENNRVHAVLMGTRNDAIKELYRRVPRELLTSDIIVAAILPELYTQTVCCDTRDEFDEEVGKRLAKERLLERYYRNKRVKVLQAFRTLEKRFNRVDWPSAID